MRVFFFGLLLLNVGYFAWQYFNPADSQSQDVQVRQNAAQRIMLSREISPAKKNVASGKADKPVVKSAPVVKQEEKKEAVIAKVQEPKVTPATKPVPIVAEPKKDCYSVGAFTSDAGLDKAIALLRAGKYKFIVLPAKITIERYWVFIPPLSSFDEAREVARKLRSLGIRDYQILATAGKINAISLGVFSNHDIANNRLDDIRKLGFEPKIEVIQRHRSAKKLHIFPKQGEGKIKGVLDKLLGFEKGLKIDEISCQ